VRRDLVYLGAALALAATMVTIVTIGPGRACAGLGNHDSDLFRYFDPHDPNQPLLLEGERMTVDEAVDRATGPYFRPDHPCANDDIVTEAWLGPAGWGGALRYETGLRVYQSLWQFEGDLAIRFRRSTRDHPGYHLVIDGHPAFVIPEDAAGPGNPHEGVVSILIGTAEVQIYGHLSPDELIEVAESVT